MPQKRSKSLTQSQIPISVEILPGRADAVFTANVRLRNFLTIYDCIIFKDKSGVLQPTLPAKMVKAERLPVVEIEPKLRKSVVDAIRAACQQYSQQDCSRSQAPRRSVRHARLMSQLGRNAVFHTRTGVLSAKR